MKIKKHFAKIILLKIAWLIIASKSIAASPTHGGWRTNYSRVLTEAITMEHEGKLTQVDASLFTYNYPEGNRFSYLLRNGSDLTNATNNCLGAFFKIETANALHNFSILKPLGEKSLYYLTWIDGATVCIARLPNQADPFPCNGDLADYFPSFWVADHYIDLSCFEGYEKRFMRGTNYCNLTLKSMVVNLGGLSFMATNDLKENFKFSKTNGNWQIFDGVGEIRQTKSNPDRVAESLEEQKQIASKLFKGSLALKNRKGEYQDTDIVVEKKSYTSRITGWPVLVFQLLNSTNKEMALTRPIFESMRSSVGFPGNFSLVKLGSEDFFIFAFRDSYYRLCLTKISEAESDLMENNQASTVGFFSKSPIDPVVRGGVDYVIDMRQFVDSDRFFKGGGGVASASEKDNVLTLTVTNAAGSKFTFSNPDGQWHAYSFWGEINRIKK